MSKDHVCMSGPYAVELKVGITNGEQNGTVTFGAGHGEFLDAEKVKEALAKCASAAKAQGFRLMNRHEYLQEALGGAMVVIPGPKEFLNG